MKKRKSMLVLAAVLVAVLLLSGCAKKSAYEDAGYVSAPAAYPSYNDYKSDYAAAYDEGEAYYPEPEESAAGAVAYGDSTSTVGKQVQNSGQKKVYRSYLSIESTDFDANYNAIMAKLDECGGYVSSSDMSGGLNYDGTPRMRRASLELKVPAAYYRDFLSAGESFGNIVNRNENVEDITSSYLDVEARLSSLKAEEARLLELLNQTGTLEELLTVEERLADVRYEIERYTSTRNTYDSWVNFCTVNIDISEVNRTKPAVETFGDRIAGAFGESWVGVAEFFRDLTVGLVYALPTLIILAVIAVIVIVIIKKTRPKRQQKAMMKAQMKAALQAQTAPVQDEAK